MSKSLRKNDDLPLRDEAVSKLKTSDDLRTAAEKLKRAPQLDDVFLLHPGSRKLLEGEPSGTERVSAMTFGVSLLGLVLILAFIGFVLSSGAVATDGSLASVAVLSLMAITGGFCSWMATISFRQFYEDRDFDHNGMLLIGSLSSIDGDWKTISSIKKLYRYSATVTYNVELPSGTIVSDMAEASRPDLEALDARPKPGTPVAVLYSPRYKTIRLL